MGLTNIRLGDYIERSTINNKDLKYGVDLIVGVNSQGVFATPNQGLLDALSDIDMKEDDKYYIAFDYVVDNQDMGMRR